MGSANSFGLQSKQVEPARVARGSEQLVHSNSVSHVAQSAKQVLQVTLYRSNLYSEKNLPAAQSGSHLFSVARRSMKPVAHPLQIEASAWQSAQNSTSQGAQVPSVATLYPNPHWTQLTPSLQS